MSGCVFSWAPGLPRFSEVQAATRSKLNIPERLSANAGDGNAGLAVHCRGASVGVLLDGALATSSLPSVWDEPHDEELQLPQCERRNAVHAGETEPDDARTVAAVMRRRRAELGLSQSRQSRPPRPRAPSSSRSACYPAGCSNAPPTPPHPRAAGAIAQHPKPRASPGGRRAFCACGRATSASPPRRSTTVAASQPSPCTPDAERRSHGGPRPDTRARRDALGRPRRSSPHPAPLPAGTQPPV